MRRLLFLLLAALPLCHAEAWEPKPWERYVIQMEVRNDTLPQHSIMQQGPNAASMGGFDFRNFHFGPFYAPEPPSLFAAYDEQIEREQMAREDYSWGVLFTDTVLDILSAFF